MNALTHPTRSTNRSGGTRCWCSSQLGQVYKDVGNTAALVMYRQVHRYVTTLTESDPDTPYGWRLHDAGVLRAGARHDEVIEVCRLALSVLDHLPGADRAGAIGGLHRHGRDGRRATAKWHRSVAQKALEQAVRTAEESIGGTPSADPRHQAAW
jgi:hypothetical protein